MGPERTVACYQEWIQVLVRPALGTGNDRSRVEELTGITATDSQSLVALFHNTCYLDRSKRPGEISATVRLAHWMVGGILTVLTIVAASRCRRPEWQSLFGMGGLVVVMLLLSPVCHLHYFCLSLPLVMGLVLVSWEHTRWKVSLGILFSVYLIATVLPHLPGLEVLRDVCLAAYANLLLWATALLVLAFLPQAHSLHRVGLTGGV
jgi:hypothetical protein